MREFKDRDGNVWRIDLNIGNVFRVRSGSGGKFDLLDSTHDVGGQPLSVVLATDLHEFWEVLWFLVELQAREKSITAERFGQAMAGDCLIASQQAFLDEWRDFFHSLRRPDAALSVESQAKMIATAVELVTERIKQIDQPSLERKITATVERAVNAAYGTVRESLAAILDPTPGDNST